MPHPAERRLARIAVDIDWLRAITPQVLAALETVAANGWPRGGGDGRGGATGTTVETAVTDHARHQADLLDARTAELAGVVTELVNQIKAMPKAIDPRLKHNAAAEAIRARCSGGEGDWGDPHCTNLEVRTVKSDEVRGVELGVCWTHLSRRRRWRHEQDDQVAS